MRRKGPDRGEQRGGRRRLLRRGTFRGQDLADAEIGDYRFVPLTVRALNEQNVGGLEVAVNHGRIEAMKMANRSRQVFDSPMNALEALCRLYVLPAAYKSAQVAAIRIFKL